MKKKIEQNYEDWVKHSVVDESRVDELVEIYESLGYDVRVEPLADLEEETCGECLRPCQGQFKVIFTRKKHEAAQAKVPGKKKTATVKPKTSTAAKTKATKKTAKTAAKTSLKRKGKK